MKVSRREREEHARDTHEAGVRPLSKGQLAKCKQIDADLHAKWGWSKDPEHVKNCAACKAAKAMSRRRKP